MPVSAAVRSVFADRLLRTRERAELPADTRRVLDRLLRTNIRRLLDRVLRGRTTKLRPTVRHDAVLVRSHEPLVRERRHLLVRQHEPLVQRHGGHVLVWSHKPVVLGLDRTVLVRPHEPLVRHERADGRIVLQRRRP